MILIDTNVISEPWKPAPNAQALAWIDAQAIETLYLSTITVAELRFGIAAMPAGKRRTTLHERLEGEVLPLFANRVLPFDLDASKAFAALMVRAQKSGKAIGTADGYIAAIATAHGFAVATRDASAFKAASVSIIDPWTTGH